MMKIMQEKQEEGYKVRLLNIQEKMMNVKKQSNILRHFYQCNHKNMSRNKFQILGNEYKKIKFKRKLSETLYIKELRPTLNRQETSVTLDIFN